MRCEATSRGLSSSGGFAGMTFRIFQNKGQACAPGNGPSGCSAPEEGVQDGV